MKAICVLTNASDYRYRGAHFVEEGEQETVVEAIKAWYDPSVANEVIEEEIQGADFFFIDPAVVARLQSIKQPLAGGDSANDALGELMINVCRAFAIPE